MNKVCVNLKTRFKYFHYCHFEGKMIDQNKVLLDEPLNCIIKVKDEDVPIPIPNKNWKIGQKVLINQCYDGGKQTLLEDLIIANGLLNGLVNIKYMIILLMSKNF